MSHNIKIVDKEPYDNAMKIFIEVKIDGDKCGYSQLDGEVLKFDFDMDYERYQDNEKVKKDAKAWGRKLVNKRIEECDPSPDPVGEELQL